MAAPDPIALPWQDFDARMAELAAAYLQEPYDCLFYVVRGGMTPAHRLAHLLGIPADPERLRPLYIRRHEDDSVQAQTRAPQMVGEISSLAPGARLLLVEDTIGAGATLEVALEALRASRPARLDVLSVGLDHRDLTYAGTALASLGADRLIVGFDYWGWLVFPWENSLEAKPRSAPQPLALRAEEAREALALAQSLRPEAGDRWLSPEWLADRSVGEFRSSLQELARALPAEGRLVLGFLDRERVCTAEDLEQGREFYAPALVASLARSAGLPQMELLGAAGRLSFAALRAGLR